MSTKVTITPENLNEVNKYLGVDVAGLNAISDPSLYQSDPHPSSTTAPQPLSTDLVSDESEDLATDSEGDDHGVQLDPLLVDGEIDTPLENRQQPAQPKVNWTDNGQTPTDASGEVVVHPDDAAQRQTKLSGDDKGTKGSDVVNVVAMATSDAAKTIDHIHNTTADQVQLEPASDGPSPNQHEAEKSLQSKSPQPLSVPTPKSTTQPSTTAPTSTRSQQQAAARSTGGHGTHTGTEGEAQIQVERIIIRKQQLQEWGTYRIDKFGRVINEPQSEKSKDESSLTRGGGGGMSPSESSSHMIPQTTTVNTLPAQTHQIDPKALAKKLERETKWVHMVDKWDETKPALLKSRIRKGIPSSMRGIVWAKIMKTDEAKQSHPLRYYYDLLSKPVLEQHEIQIRKDLPRLMQDNIMFRSPEAGSRTVMCSGQAMLYNILRAYSIHDPEVGYVQGMDTVAAPALLYFPEETTFWFLERLLQSPKYKLRDLYLDGFPLARKYGFVHEQLVKRFLPRLYKAMDQQLVQHTVYAFRWYTMRYAQFAPEMSYRVLDIYLHEGDKILYRIALALLSLYEKRLLGAPEEMLENLKSIETDYDLHSKDNGDFIINKALKINLTTQDIVDLGALYEKLDAAGELV